MPEENGKIIIVDAVLEPQGNGMFDNTALVFDLVMLAHSSGGTVAEREHKANGQIY